MQHNQRNILIAFLLTMLTLAGCSAPNKQKNPQELRKEAYEILEGKNGSRTTLQELKEAGHKFVDSLSEDIAQKLSKGNSRPSTIRLSPQQCKERLKRYGGRHDRHIFIHDAGRT